MNEHDLDQIAKVLKPLLEEQAQRLDKLERQTTRLDELERDGARLRARCTALENVMGVVSKHFAALETRDLRSSDGS